MNDIKTSKLCFEINALSSNVWGLLKGEATDFRFLRIGKNEYNEYTCSIGFYGDDGTPLVAFGNHETLDGSIRNVGRSLANDKFFPDKYLLGSDSKKST